MARACFSGMFVVVFLLVICFPACAQNAEQQPAPSPAPATASAASSADSTQLAIISSPKPEYPKDAKKNKVQGRVWIQLMISPTGDVESADIISGHPDLAQAAQEAVKKWKFKPYIRNGRPVKVSTKMPFDFSFGGGVEINILSHPSTEAPDSQADTAVTSSEDSSGNLPQKIRVSSGVAESMVLHQVQPVYPTEAKEIHLQGEVIFQATIGKDGLIHNLKVVSGHPVLVEAAKDAVEQWRYRPYILKGSPVEVETTIKVAFHM